MGVGRRISSNPMSEPAKAFEADGTRTALCDDCGGKHKVTQLAWDMAMTFREVLVQRGETPMSGVGRCDPCQVLWLRAQDEARANRYYRDVELFRRMRKGLASIEAREVSRSDVVLFIASLPDDFRLEHNAAVASFRSEADRRFTELDKKHKGKGQGFE